MPPESPPERARPQPDRLPPACRQRTGCFVAHWVFFESPRAECPHLSVLRSDRRADQAQSAKLIGEPIKSTGNTGTWHYSASPLERASPQVRDILAYFITCAVTLQFLWNAQFSAREATLLIVMYFVYLLVCIYTSRCPSISVMPSDRRADQAIGIIDRRAGQKYR